MLTAYPQIGNDAPSLQPQQPHTSLWCGIPFTVLPTTQTLIDFTGIHIFSLTIDVQRGSRKYPVQYAVSIGQSDANDGRVLYHGIHSDHIHCLKIGDRSLITKIERLLVSTYNPPRNRLYRTGPSASEISAVVPDWWESGSHIHRVGADHDHQSLSLQL